MYSLRTRVAAGVITALVIALLSSTAALADGPWPNDPQGPVARSIADLYWIMFVAAVVVLAIVDGAIIYAGIKFRERPGHVAQQFHGHNMLELTWTVIPTIMVVGFSVLSWQQLDFINNTRGNVGMVIQAEGNQWTWQFSYPQEERFKLLEGYLKTGEELHIPVGMKVRIELSAKDVIHSFWVPSVGGKKDAVPGRATELWIQADKPGTFKGQCFEFCGDGHADMLITLVAHAPTEYAAWIVQAVKDANVFLDPNTKVGRELFFSLACVGCHTIDRTTARGKIGPNLTHLMSQKSIAGGLLSPVNEETLTRWISDPPAVKPGTLMPNLNLSPEQVRDIVLFLQTLR
ncbi:MAG: cytochrome c oxidase subunit II [Candidatus Limnocylindria bacterium]